VAGVTAERKLIRTSSKNNLFEILENEQYLYLKKPLYLLGHQVFPCSQPPELLLPLQIPPEDEIHWLQAIKDYKQPTEHPSEQKILKKHCKQTKSYISGSLRLLHSAICNVTL
jgi:hypothetical protein